MLTIVKGDANIVKAEMQEVKSKYQAELKELRAELKVFNQELREARKEKDEKRIKHWTKRTEAKRTQIRNIENSGVIGAMTPTTIMPVYVEGNYYNLALYKQMEKKLKGFDVKTRIDKQGRLVMEYTKGRASGSLRLVPMTVGELYRGYLKNIPKAVVSK